MVGIGPIEMLVIAGVALVVIGPEKFPNFAKVCMRTFRDVRGYIDDAKQDITKELTPVKEELDELKSYDPEEYLDAMTGSEDSPESLENTTGEGEGEDPYGYNYGNEYEDDYAYGGADTTSEGETPAGEAESSETSDEADPGEMTQEGATQEPVDLPDSAGEEVELPEGENQDGDDEFPERLDG